MDFAKKPFVRHFNDFYGVALWCLLLFSLYKESLYSMPLFPTELSRSSFHEN
jgi:hypothetical protein